MRFLSLCLFLVSSPAWANDPLLGWPVQCELGENCYIQQYMDRDPGPGAVDYQCAPLSYDTHRGTDIALPTLADMERGVNIIAAAPGVVIATRDGVPDQLYSDETAAQVAGRECGNRVAINHGGGWITDYCHMKQGSIAVQKGDRVAMGTVLGQIGLSGRTQFPHLHFSVQNGRTHVDPFDPDGDLDCTSVGEDTLWLETPTYRAGGILEVAYTGADPDFTRIKAGTQPVWNSGQDKLISYVYGFGLREGDEIRMYLIGPNGIEVRKTYAANRNQALFLRYIGVRRDHWPFGDYLGRAELIRNGQVIDQRDWAFSAASE